MAKKQSQTPEGFDNELLKKRVFVRALNPVKLQYTNSSPSYSYQKDEAKAPTIKFEKVTQDTFLAELNPESHDINNPFIYPDKIVKSTIKNASGVDEEISTLNQVARVSIALQQMIATKQCVHLWANKPKFTSRRDGNSDMFMRFKEYWTERNASSALYLMAKSALTTGDGAIYFFMTANGLAYKVWSYKDGDQLIPVYKSNGVDMEMFIRRYYTTHIGYEQTMDTIDVYDQKTVTRYVLDKKIWVKIGETESHGFFQIPIAYHREEDVAWGKGQDLINKIERLMSDIRESNSYFSFGIMFLAGEDVKVLPPKTSQGKVIISENPESNAKMLEQNDMSASLKFEFDEYWKQLCRVTGTVVIDQENLKGGDQSGAYIKNLYNDAIQYALDAKPAWQPVLDKIVSVVKEGLGREEKLTLEYNALVVIADPDIYVPMNVAEEVRLVNESLTAGAISQETAAQTNAFASPDEVNRLNNQKIKEDERTASIASNETRDASGAK